MAGAEEGSTHGEDREKGTPLSKPWPHVPRSCIPSFSRGKAAGTSPKCALRRSPRTCGRFVSPVGSARRVPPNRLWPRTFLLELGG